MKRNSLFIMFCLAMLICSLPVLGQIVFNSTDVPSTIGSQFSELSSIGTVTLDPGPAGANQTWDLRGISSPEEATLEIIDRSQTPNPAWIPDANHIVEVSGIGQELGYIYTQVTSTFGKLLGTGYQLPESSWVTEWTNDPPNTVFPVHYGDSWMSRLHWEEGIEGFMIEYIDTSWATVDAWGTVILDDLGSIQCLRTKRHSHMVAIVMGIPMIDEWTWAYEWIAPGYLGVAHMSSEAGGSEHFTTGYFTRAGSGAKVEESIQIIPLAFELQTPFPNPFNPETTIPYSVRELTDIRLAIYNALGQEVRILVNGRVVPGSYTVSWNGMDSFGNPVGTGVYYCRLLSPEGQSSSQKLMLIR